MKKLLSILLLIPSLAFGASAGGGAGSNITSESQHPLRHKDNRIVTEAYGANSGVTVEAQLHNIIDGIGISPGTYVPYTGAISAVDLNSQSLTTTGTLSAGATTLTDLTLGSATGVKLSATSGVLTIAGIGGTNNENLTWNFDVLNGIGISSTTGVTAIYWNDLDFNIDLDQYIRLGSQSTVRAKFGAESTGNDSIQFGLVCNEATRSGYFSFMEYADLGNANRSPLALSVDPVLRIYSSDATEALDYLEFYHNQTNPVINIGNGALSITGGNVLINSADDDGTPTTGKLVVKGSTNDGSTNAQVWRDSDEANVATLDTNGNMVVSGLTVVAMTANGQYNSTEYTCTTTLDWNNGNVQYIVLASGAQTFTFANPKAGGRYLIMMKQPTGGADGTVTWPANVSWSGAAAPTLTTTDAQVDIVTFVYDTNNDQYFGGFSLNYAP